MFLLLSGQTDITDRLSFCSSHLCFPRTEKLPSVVCFLLSCPKTTALNKRECVHLFSVVCVYTGGNKTENTLGLFYYTYYLCLWISIPIRIFKGLFPPLQQHFSVSKNFGSDFIQCSDLFTGNVSKLVHV